MSIKVKAWTLGAAAVVAVTAGFVSEPLGQASTTACGANCTAPSNQALGAGLTPAVSLPSGCGTVTAAAIQPPSLSTTCAPHVGLVAVSSTDPGQDWVAMLEGGSNGVATFINNGVLSHPLGIQYSADDVVEFEVAPSGVPSDMCMASSTTTPLFGGSPTPVLTLARCGTSSSTAWIIDQGNDSGGFVDLVTGASASYSDPGVLATIGTGTKASLTVAPLSEIGGVVSPAQMWSFSFSATSTAAVKAGPMKHT